MLGILDYKAGNHTSVARALETLTIPWVISHDADTLRTCSGVIFPGVGAAGQAMLELKSAGLDMLFRELAQKKHPLLGICLGSQILLDYSEENDTPLLGIVEGECKRFPDGLEEEGDLLPIPHMGWNSLTHLCESRLFANIPKEASFYFVHSYYTIPPRTLRLCQTHYGIDFCSAYGKDGLWGVQFHPEKSGRFGLQILENFYRFCEENHAH